VTNRFEIRVLLTAVLFLAPITGGLTTLVIVQEREKVMMSPDNDGFVEPAYLGWLINQTQKSLVTIDCNGLIGSGFSFELDSYDRGNGFSYHDIETEQAKSIVITNHHVVKECIKENEIMVRTSIDESSIGNLKKLDELNDLALLTIDFEVPPLVGSDNQPFPGYWTMALGSPHGFEGSVTFGNVINLDEKRVFHTASLSPGNSGGPLVDNEGLLIGVNTGSKPVGQNFNISIGVNSFCDVLIKCRQERYWSSK
jgi:serine protease Do